MSSFELNTAAFGKEVLEAPWMQAEMVRRAQLVMAMAISIAPEGRNTKTMGRRGTSYKQSFRINSGVRTAPPFRTARAYAQVENTKPYAMHIEWGTGNGRPGRTDTKGSRRQRILGRSLDAAKG